MDGLFQQPILSLLGGVFLDGLFQQPILSLLGGVFLLFSLILIMAGLDIFIPSKLGEFTGGNKSLIFGTILFLLGSLLLWLDISLLFKPTEPTPTPLVIQDSPEPTQAPESTDTPSLPPVVANVISTTLPTTEIALTIVPSLTLTAPTHVLSPEPPTIIIIASLSSPVPNGSQQPDTSKTTQAIYAQQTAERETAVAAWKTSEAATSRSTTLTAEAIASYTPTPTHTSIPPFTLTPTSISIPVTKTPTSTPIILTNTPAPTFTPIPPSATPTPSGTVQWFGGFSTVLLKGGENIGHSVTPVQNGFLHTGQDASPKVYVVSSVPNTSSQVIRFKFALQDNLQNCEFRMGFATGIRDVGNGITHDTFTFVFGQEATKLQVNSNSESEKALNSDKVTLRTLGNNSISRLEKGVVYSVELRRTIDASNRATFILDVDSSDGKSLFWVIVFEDSQKPEMEQLYPNAVVSIERGNPQIVPWIPKGANQFFFNSNGAGGNYACSFQITDIVGQ